MVMTILWSVAALVMLVLAAMKRALYLLAPMVGLVVAAVLAWLEMGLLYQGLAVLASVGLALTLRELLSPPEHEVHRDYVESRLTESATLMSSFSIMDGMEEDVFVTKWDAKGNTEVVFHGRTYKARLASGRGQRPGRYKVLRAKAGRMEIEAFKD